MSNNFPNNLNTANSFPCGGYGPFGTNDNNFNRQQFPSNIFPENGGMNGNYFGNYNPLSTNTQANMGKFSNFDKSYANNEPMIERMNYKNQNNLIHNNVGETVLDENIVEYRVYIDSVDRDVTVYPSPFNFTVKFNASSKSIIHDVKFAGTPGPVISREFRNVKYIKLETIILPQFSKYIKCNNNYVPDPESYLPDDRYVMLVINELDECNQIYSTLDNGARINPDTGYKNQTQKPFGLILPDSKYGHVYYSGTTYTAQRMYRNSTLGNLTKMTLQLYDSNGNLLSYDHLLKPDQLNDMKSSDIRHPLNKKVQVHYTFVIGVVEPQVNNNTKYEK
jgi:hypothetical protein